MERLSGPEIRSTILFSLIFSLRMLGLFMIYPVLALYTHSLAGANPTLIGVALGIYGLFQAIFQLPFGWLSDHYGRKPIVLVGLGLFSVGSLLAAFSGSIMGIIMGRAIQGAGAIGSPILAWVADSTREKVRARAMAMIGVTIGLTFTLSLILGPWLEAKRGLSGLFLLTAVLAILGMISVILFTKEIRVERPLIKKDYGTLREKTLWRLYAGIFVLHAILTASFLILPLKIQAITGLVGNVWKFYLPVLGLSLILVVPILRYADMSSKRYSLMLWAMSLLAGAGVIFFAAESVWWLGVGITGFFVGFNFLEASLPAAVSCLAPVERRGMALGLYSCAQFLGLFSGGVLGGIINEQWGHSGVEIFYIGLILTGCMALKIHSNQFQNGKSDGRNHGKGHK